MRSAGRYPPDLKNIMKKTKVIAVVIVLVFCVSAGMFYYLKQIRPASDADTMQSKLKNASELTTQELIYQGVFHDETGSIPFINKDKFLVKYKATVRAGFDVSDAKVAATDDTVTVTIPHAKILSVNIQADDIKFYDTNFSIIDGGKQAAIEAEKKAEKNTKKYASKSGLLDAADANGSKVIKAFLSDAAGKRDIIVKFK